VEGLNWLMGSQILLLDNWISNGKKWNENCWNFGMPLTRFVNK
jgi:hypothetical protein